MSLISPCSDSVSCVSRNPECSVLQNVKEILEIEFPSPATHEKSVRFKFLDVCSVIVVCRMHSLLGERKVKHLLVQFVMIYLVTGLFTEMIIITRIKKTLATIRSF